MDIAPITPAISRSLVEAITIAFVVLYGLLFFLIYIQLILILYYRHRRFSYQTVFLFLCLFWALLRTTLFSFFIQQDSIDVKHNSIQYWLLYNLPLCLQFITLCLLVLYFAQVVLKAKARFDPDQYRTYKWRLRLGITALAVIFVSINIACAIAVGHIIYAQPLVTARVIVTGALFMLCSVILSGCIWKIWRMQSANVLLEARGITVCQSSTACVLIVLLYSTRAVYNMIAINNVISCPKFGYTWLDVSDEADLVEVLSGRKYILFGVVLFIWEFVPTLVVVIFFRVRCVRRDVPEIKTGLNVPPRGYFFDNPRRYDSDDDLCRSYATNTVPRDYNHDIPSLGSTTLNHSASQTGYGTLVRSNSDTSGQYFPGTTPPMLFSGNISLGGYQNKNEIYDGT